METLRLAKERREGATQQDDGSREKQWEPGQKDLKQEESSKHYIYCNDMRAIKASK